MTPAIERKQKSLKKVSSTRNLPSSLGDAEAPLMIYSANAPVVVYTTGGWHDDLEGGGVFRVHVESKSGPLSSRQVIHDHGRIEVQAPAFRKYESLVERVRSDANKSKTAMVERRASKSALVAIGKILRHYAADRLPWSDRELVSYANSLGVRPGEKVSKAMARRVIARMSDDLRDLFSDRGSATRYLESNQFSTDNKTAADLIVEGKILSVIARLEELRFGSRG